MLGTFSFECLVCGHEFDDFVKRGTLPPCTECGEATKQIIRHAPKLDWYGMAMGESAGPEFIDRFEKDHKNRKAHEEKIEREHGDYGPLAGS